MQKSFVTIIFLILFIFPLVLSAQPKNILMVVTSADKIEYAGTAYPTGCWPEELIEPYQIFTKEGFLVTIVSPKGGVIPFDKSGLDPKMVGEDVAKKYADILQKERFLTVSLPLSYICAQPKFHYDVVVLVGGHGTVADFHNNSELKTILVRAYKNGSILSGVCHGVAGFLNLMDTDVLKGVHVTGFSNNEENIIQMTSPVKGLLGDELETLLAKMVKEDNRGQYTCAKEWQPYVVNYQNRVITGQNPTSATPMANEIVKVLKSLSNNRVKALIQKNYPVFGSFVTIGHPSVVETMCLSPIDFVWIEGEHAALSLPQIVALNMATSESKKVPIVRVPSNNMDVIKQHVDTGAMGIIVPYIKTVEDAEKAVRSLKYPPEGERGIGLGRATRYFIKLHPYLENANQDVMVILMIETKEAVQNIDQIVRVKGVDLLSVGPFDLSASLGYPGQTNHPEVQSAIAKVEEAAQKVNLPLGISVPNRKAATLMMRKGYRFFVIGADVEYLFQGANKFFQEK